jgi:ABC-type transport system involved in cytochrome c biogenesis permease subunit
MDYPNGNNEAANDAGKGGGPPKTILLFALAVGFGLAFARTRTGDYFQIFTSHPAIGIPFASILAGVFFASRRRYSPARSAVNAVAAAVLMMIAVAACSFLFLHGPGGTGATK